MDAESFTVAIRQRDEHIRALIEYARDLEYALVNNRADEVAEAARDRAYETEVSQLWYRHGLRAGLTLR
jgi:hypothetical protein